MLHLPRTRSWQRRPSPVRERVIPIAPWRQREGARTLRPPRRPRYRLTAAAVAAGLIVLATGCGGGGRQAAGSTSAQTQTQTRPTTADAIVATAATAQVPVFRSPEASAPFLNLANPTASGAPLVFLVKQRRPGWEQVYLPIRPDESTGWISDRHLRLALDPYSLNVRLRHHDLILRKHGRTIAHFTAAVGRSALPTPTGRFYIVELLKQPDPQGPYGPYAFGLSAYSHVLYRFGGGPGQIGIHGTNETTSIGRSASHGCIRIPNSAITRLANQLPLGTPVTITQ